jgi:ParB family chromosome partitioning protein
MDKLKKRKALGKGLASLMAVDSLENSLENSSNGVTLLAIDNIVPNPFQPRLDFDEDSIKELAQSIDKQGLLQPVVVRKLEDKSYQIISGERRYRAFSLLNKKELPVIIKENVDDTKMLELALVENIQRENLNVIETAISYQKLLTDCGLSHQVLSEQVGKSRSNITNTIRLLKLPSSIQMMVRDGIISMGHARALLSLGGDEKQQEVIADKVARTGMSVRELEKMVSPINPAPKVEVEPSKPINQSDNIFRSIESDWSEKYNLDFKVIGKNENRGKVEIPFTNRDEFDKIIALFNEELVSHE